MSKITLRHVTHALPTKVEYFYDGLLVAKNGAIEIEAGDEVHMRTLWLRGYRLSDDGKELFDWVDVLKYAEKKRKKPTTA